MFSLQSTNFLLATHTPQHVLILDNDDNITILRPKSHCWRSFPTVRLSHGKPCLQRGSQKSQRWARSYAHNQRLCVDMHMRHGAPVLESFNRFFHLSIVSRCFQVDFEYARILKSTIKLVGVASTNEDGSIAVRLQYYCEYPPKIFWCWIDFDVSVKWWM